MAAAFGPLAYVFAFLAAVITFQIGASIFFRLSDAAKRVNRRLSLFGASMTREAFATLVRKPTTEVRDGAFWSAWMEQFEMMINQAGLSVTPLQLVSTAGGIAMAIWIAAIALAGVAGGRSPVLALVSLFGAIMLATLGVWMWLRGKRAKRLKMIDEQLPWALDVINRALRAGHPVLSAVSLAASELGEPLGSELNLIVDATTYGAEFKDALRAFAQRTGSPDVHFFAVAVGVQSETGGNLSEILEGLSTIMRSRTMLGKKVSALAGEGKASAWLLTALPIGLLAYQLTLNPSFYMDKLNDPIFWPAAGGLAVLFVIGWFMMNRIINFKY